VIDQASDSILHITSAEDDI